MENMKLPIALVAALAVQLAGGVWWVSQQAATIEDLTEDIEVLTVANRAADKVNMQRDIQQNEKEINDIWDDSDDVWNEISALALSINAINELKQRIALLENELKYVNRDHDSMIMQKSGE